MKKRLLQVILLICLSASTSDIYALSDGFYASGEDLEYMFETNSNYALEELEDELRKFVFYCKIEDLILDLDDEYPGISQ
ncbi:MAG: hypothetical protein ACI88H_004168 [Cocleimonas sp.]|jgi:hypothetical protein